MNPGKKELMELAKVFSIDRAEHIIEEVKSAVRDWRAFAADAGVTRTSTKMIADQLSWTFGESP